MRYFIVIAFFFCNCLAAQEANNTMIKNDIKANFSVKVLEAYEENSFLKVKDLYQLLEIYSAKNSSEALQKQIKENIYSLFKENVLVSDFFTSDKITIEKLLEKIASKGLKFELQNIQKEATSSNFWTASYALTISRDKEILQKNIQQKIYFYPEEKSFGNKRKEIWSILLGEIQ